jgi:tRNA G18 (ribose-2'-O)-methylase SpoU
MGAVFSVPWTRTLDWQATRDVLHEFGFHIAALALTDRSVSLKEFARERPDRVALVLGTEGDGITGEAMNIADSVVRIPMRSGVDSLNVASASAVALYALCPDDDPRMSQ